MFYRIGEDNTEFYNKLNEIRSKAIKSISNWNGAYYDTTYTMNDGTQYEYSEDMDYGIPYSLKLVHNL